MSLTDAKAVAAKQAEDDDLWRIPRTVPVAYLQMALRELHAALEGEDVSDVLAGAQTHARSLPEEEPSS